MADKREREADASLAGDDDGADVGPPRPPPGGAPDSDDEGPPVGPLPPAKKKRVRRAALCTPAPLEARRRGQP